MNLRKQLLYDVPGQRKLPRTLESTKEHYAVGKLKGKFRLSKLLLASGDTTLIPTQVIPPPSSKQFCTPELAAELNNQISNDKLLLCSNSIQDAKSSPRSAVGSTSNARRCLPYWDESCQAMSESLWSHTRIDLPASDLTSFNGSANKTGANSWFSTKQVSVQSRKWLRISSPSFTALAPGFTDSASTKLRCKRIQIYPSPELNRTWRQWLSACRYCFNQAIAYQRQNGGIGKRKLRNIVMQSALPEWVKKSPCHIRQNAIFDAHQAFTASREAKFRSVRDYQQTIKFNDSNYSQGRWYPRLVKDLAFLASEPLPKYCEFGTQLSFTKGRWFAVIPEERSIETKSDLVDGIIALDPGVRTFLTGFDGQRFTEFGQGDMGRITRLCQHLDSLMSRAAAAAGKRRRRMHQAARRMRTKIRHLIDEAHKQIAHYLTANYRVIFLPTFETSQMVAKAKRKIGSKTARAMLTWAHHRFKLFLAHKAEMTQTILITGSEAYTSKTCTRCGHVHNTLGGSKVFKCPSCGHKLPRDWNGALGFLLRALRDTAWSVDNNGLAIAALSGKYPYCVA